MSVIEANVNINIPDNVDPRETIAMIQSIVSRLNDKNTHINIVEADNPLSLSPISLGTHKE